MIFYIHIQATIENIYMFAYSASRIIHFDQFWLQNRQKKIETGKTVVRMRKLCINAPNEDSDDTADGCTHKYLQTWTCNQLINDT